MDYNLLIGLILCQECGYWVYPIEFSEKGMCYDCKEEKFPVYGDPAAPYGRFKNGNPRLRPKPKKEAKP